VDPATGLLIISSSKYARLQTLSMHVGGTSYDLSPNAQIWPRSLNTAIGGSSGFIYLVVGDIGSTSGSGFDFINGYTFLYVVFCIFSCVDAQHPGTYFREYYYSVYDTTNGRVGFATTAYTDATTN
jgi:saccharopepsin